MTLTFFKWWSWEHLLSIFVIVLWEESKMQEERWQEYMFCVSMSHSHIVVGIGYISLRDPLAISRSYCDWVVQLPLKTALWLCWQSQFIYGSVHLQTVFCFKDFIRLPHMAAHERLKIKYQPEGAFLLLTLLLTLKTSIHQH